MDGIVQHGDSEAQATAADDPALRFDPEWFGATYTGSAAVAEQPGGPSLFQLYVAQARELGVSPNPHFDEKHYRAVHEDVRCSVEQGRFWCGFDHYIRHGHAERRRARRPERRIAIDLRRFGAPQSDPFQDAYVGLWVRGLVHLLPEAEFLLVLEPPGVERFADVEGANARRLPVSDLGDDAVRALHKRSVDYLLSPYGSAELLFPDYAGVMVADRSCDLGARPATERTGLLREWTQFDTILCADPEIERDVHDTVGPEGIAVGRLPLAALARGELARARLRRDPSEGRVVVVAGPIDPAALQPLLEVFRRLPAEESRDVLRFALTDAPGDRVASFGAIARKNALRCVVGAVGSGRRDDLLSALARAGVIVDLGSAWRDSIRILGDAIGVPVLRGAAGEAFGADALLSGLGAPATRGGPVALEAGTVLAALDVARSAASDRTVLHGVSSRDGSIGWLAMRVAASPIPRVAALSLQFPHGAEDRRIRLERWLNGRLQERIAVEPGAVRQFEVSLPADGGILDWRLVSVDAAGSWHRLQGAPETRMRCLHAFVRESNQVLLTGPGGEAGQAAAGGLDRINALIDAYEPLKHELIDGLQALSDVQPAMRLKIPNAMFLGRIARPRVLHVVKPSYLDPAMLFHGSTKDILGRRNYFRDRGFDVDELVVPPKQGREAEAVRTLMARRGVEYDIIFIEYLLYPELMEYLRDRYPEAQILVRGHNAEILHRLHTMYATWLTSGELPWRDRIRALAFRNQLRTVRRYLNDELACARLADRVLSISDWESKHYWPLVAGSRKTATVPYFVPAEIRRRYPPAERTRRIVALSSVGPGPLAVHALQNFKKLVGASASTLPGWTFSATGGFDADDIIRHGNINFVGTVADPIDELRGAAAMALLSPLGYGFKTKIMDAVTARAFILLPKSLLKRVPAELRAYCIAADPSCSRSFAEAARRAMSDWPGGDPNELLRERAFHAMDNLFGIRNFST